MKRQVWAHPLLSPHLQLHDTHFAAQVTTDDPIDGAPRTLDIHQYGNAEEEGSDEDNNTTFSFGKVAIGMRGQDP